MNILRNNSTKFLVNSIVTLLILIHIWVIIKWSVNMPYLDDYTFIIDILHLKDVHFALPEVFKTLFTPTGPHLEHLILFGRLIAIFDFLIEGQLNFKTLILAGNITLLLTIGLLFYTTHQANLPTKYCLPVAFILLQPQYHENTLTWSICALQHLPGLFFALLTFYFLTRQSIFLFASSFPVAIFGVFSNGNGLAILIVGFVILFICNLYKRLAIWTLFSVISFYFYYKFTHQYPSTSNDLNLLHPFRVLGGFFLLSGSIWTLFTRSLVLLTLSGIASTFLLIIIVISAIIQFPIFKRVSWLITSFLYDKILNYSTSISKKNSAVLIALYLYLVITIAGISFARSIGWHYALLLPRFIWFATILLCVGYLLAMVVMKPIYRPKFYGIILIFSMLFNITSYWLNMEEVVNINKSLSSDLHNWRVNKMLITMPSGQRTYDRYYSYLLDRAVQEKIYTLPKPEFESALDTPIQAEKGFNPIMMDTVFTFGERRLERLTFHPTKYFQQSVIPGNNQAHVLLRSGNVTLVWPIDQSRNKLATFLVNGNPPIQANTAVIYLDMLPETSYQIGFLYKNGNIWKAEYSIKRLDVRQKAIL